MSRVLRLGSDINVARDDGGCVLLDLKRGAYYALNDVGAAIVEIAQAGTAEDEIHTLISNRYGVGLEAIRPDVDRFIVQLEKLGLLNEV